MGAFGASNGVFASVECIIFYYCFTKRSTIKPGSVFAQSWVAGKKIFVAEGGAVGGQKSA